MKELTELEIERGAKKSRTTILYDVLEEERAERWIENFLDHPLTLQQPKQPQTIPATQKSKND